LLIVACYLLGHDTVLRWNYYLMIYVVRNLVYKLYVINLSINN